MIPLLLGATALNDFFRLQVLEGILVFGLLYISGFLVNSLMDIDVDIKYKTRISSSVSIMGKRTLFWLFIAHLVAASVLSIHIALLLNDPWVLALVVVGVVLGVGYSVRPMHFKVRGILHTITLSISALFIPLLFLYVCMAGWPSVPILVLLIGFAILHYGIALANQSGDYLEDEDAGMRTPAVRWGLKRTLAIGLMMNAVGLCVIIAGILFRVYYIDTTIPYRFFIALFLVPFILAIGYYTPIKGMIDLYAISKQDTENLGQDAEVERSNRIKQRMNYPKWQASGVYSLFTVSMLLFITVAYFPASETTSENPILHIDPDYSGVEIGEIDFGNKLTPEGTAKVSVWVDINDTHNTDELFITCRSRLGKEVLENRTHKVSDIRTSDLSEEDIRVGFRIEAHELNDTEYSIWLYHWESGGKLDLLDSKIVPPNNEIFITNATWYIEPGVVKDSLFIDVLVYNRLYRRNPETLSVRVTGNLYILSATVTNNGTVEPDSYWQAPTIKMEVSKTPGTFDLGLQYNGEEQDLLQLNL